jgi:hypothetical protein
LGLGPSPPFKSYSERQNLCDLAQRNAHGREKVRTGLDHVDGFYMRGNLLQGATSEANLNTPALQIIKKVQSRAG